ncbi:translation initiation factor IF-2-like isoform X1 [Melopsittacus undulatus]|nr:translation initiation factor IF-2-like isoform X1 [Melopsittacus undulatus]XP_033922815.1 translation initiation factor IF-2-like isoform X1 [Melopsittacus undulatus]XP_033924792.1 translation initiation factor IF-2-like isoform X1 [Melopsittacus undulatus]
MAAQSRAPPQPPPSPLLTAPAPAPLSAPPPWPPYGGGRGGEGREGAGGGREPSGSGRSRHLPLPPPPGTAQPGSARHGSARPRVEPGHRGGLGQAGSRRGAVAGGRRCCPGLQRGPCPPSHPSCRRHSCSPRPLRVTVSTATAAAAAPGHGLHGNSCCRRSGSRSPRQQLLPPLLHGLGIHLLHGATTVVFGSSVQPCAHCVCQNRPFQELQKTFLASFFHLQDQKGKRGFCNWEAGEESGGPRFPLDIWVLPAEFAALGVVFVELGPALLRRRQGLEGGRENQEQVSPSIFL